MAAPLHRYCYFLEMLKKAGAGVVALGASIPSALAHCPLCTVATGVAVGISRWYGVDDALIGILIAGFVVSSGLWVNNILKRRKAVVVPFQGTALVLLSLILTVVGFKSGGLFIGPPYLGLPRLLTGMVFGTVAGGAGEGLHAYLRSVNQGTNFIPLQGISIMIGALWLAIIAVAGGFL